MSLPPETQAVDAAIASRMSVRAFTAQSVAQADIEAILTVASRAPSGTNCQPWRVYVLQGASRDALVGKVCAAHDALRADPSLAAQYREEYDYYPENWVSPYIDRRRENGWGLYGLLGIGKGDKDQMHAQHQRNYRFFDAPVGLMFTVDKVMGRGSLVEYGAFLQNIMVAATEQSLSARYVDKTTLLHNADHVMLVLPYSPEAHHTLGAAELACMKPTATLINLARGGIVDDAALAQALRQKTIAAAGLDVFEGEPRVHPDLLTVPNVVLTPHIASATAGTRQAMADVAVDNLVGFLVHGQPRTPLNPQALKVSL